MIKVGLTGNFHSGHREIVDYFYESGTPVFDADLIVKYLLNHKYETIQKIKSNFGDNSYSYGLLNLFKFDNNKKFEKLLSLIKPDVFSYYEKFRQKNYKYPYTIFLSSILFEKGWNKHMNYNINVFHPNMLRKKEILNKSSIQLDMVEYILDNEMDEYEKNSKADFIIHNYGEINRDFSIKNEIYQIHSNLIRNCQNIDYIKTF